MLKFYGLIGVYERFLVRDGESLDKTVSITFQFEGKNYGT